nr:DUF4406 domain-containing protein [Gordonibacter sp.]
MRRTLYLSGPVSGIQGDNRAEFEEAARRLKAAGYAARIPHDDIKPGTPWTQAMRLSLMAIMAQADGLAMLPNWRLSRGAMLEKTVACALGLPVMTVDEWVHLN